jgi:hypothetical protein
MGHKGKESPMVKADSAFFPGASQSARGMLSAILLPGDSGLFGRRGIHCEPMIPGISLMNLINKVGRQANSLDLTPAVLANNISMDRGFNLLRPNLRRIL